MPQLISNGYERLKKLWDSQNQNENRIRNRKIPQFISNGYEHLKKFFFLGPGQDQGQGQGQNQNQNQNQNSEIPRIWIVAFISNVIIIVLSILRIFYPESLHAICEGGNAFFTSLTERIVGISFLVISILGTAALVLNFASKPFVILSRTYLATLFVAIWILLSFIIAEFVIIGGGGSGEEISGKAYKEYRLQSYSTTLQEKINSHWNATRSCLVDTNICKSFIDSTSGKNVTQFNATRLSPIECGCCKPSNDCGFIFISPTNWMKPENVNMTNNDCGSWSNDDKELCYDCDACKAGMLQSVKDRWTIQGIIYIGFDTFLLIVFIVGYNALPWKEEIKHDSVELTLLSNIANAGNLFKCF